MFYVVWFTTRPLNFSYYENRQSLRREVEVGGKSKLIQHASPALLLSTRFEFEWSRKWTFVPIGSIWVALWGKPSLPPLTLGSRPVWLIWVCHCNSVPSLAWQLSSKTSWRRRSCLCLSIYATSSARWLKTDHQSELVGQRPSLLLHWPFASNICSSRGTTWVSSLLGSTNRGPPASSLAVNQINWKSIASNLQTYLVLVDSSNRDVREAALRLRIEELERENAALSQRLCNTTNWGSSRQSSIIRILASCLLFLLFFYSFFFHFIIRTRGRLLIAIDLLVPRIFVWGGSEQFLKSVFGESFFFSSTLAFILLFYYWTCFSTCQVPFLVSCYIQEINVDFPPFLMGSFVSFVSPPCSPFTFCYSLGQKKFLPTPGPRKRESLWAVRVYFMTFPSCVTRRVLPVKDLKQEEFLWNQ